jgi:flagellar protein FliL
MAERKDALPAEADDDTEVAPEPKRSRRFPKWLALIPIILLPAAGGALLAFSKYETIAVGSTEAWLRFAAAGSSEAAPRAYGDFIKIDGMIVNPARSEGKRFLLVDIGLESTSSAALGELQQKEIVVRDTILKVLGSRTVEELTSLDHRNAMKEDILGAINSVLTKGTIEYLYFTQYVLQ